MNRILIFFTLWSLFLVFDLSGQDLNECTSKLKSVWSQYHELSKNLPEEKIYFMDYSVESKLRGAKNQVGSQRIQMFLNKNNLHIKNGYLEVYGTNQYTASILSHEKRVLISPLVIGFENQQRSGRAMILMDNLFKHYQVTSCTNYVDSNIYKVRLSPDSEGLSKFNVQEANISYSDSDNQLLSMDIDMGPAGNLEKVSIQFHAINLDYKEKIEFVDFLNEYLTSEKLLTGKYANYHLTDLRDKM